MDVIQILRQSIHSSWASVHTFNLRFPFQHFYLLAYNKNESRFGLKGLNHEWKKMFLFAVVDAVVIVLLLNNMWVENFPFTEITKS
jgi:hypothetical protein